MKGIIQTVTSPETAIDLVVYIEKYGKDFYRTACVKSESQKVREAFGILAEDEDEHLEHYKKLQETLSADHTSTTDFIGEYGHFLELIAEEITSDLYFSQDMSHEEVVRMALRYEKDAMLLINELRHLFDTEESWEIADTVFQEEKDHYFSLKKLLKKL